jgi:hypothetical protein
MGGEKEEVEVAKEEEDLVEGENVEALLYPTPWLLCGCPSAS